jgi:hypothetical protein
MKSAKAILAAALSLALTPRTILAHHGLESQFDTKKTVTVTGTVQRIDWSNPHVRLYVDVRDASAPLTTWEMDMGSPNLQMMNGWKIDTYKKGDQVTVVFYPAKDGSNVGYGRKVSAARK